MTPDRWEEIKKLVRTSYSVLDEYTEDLDPGQAQILEFESPLGLVQLQLVTRPKLLKTKTSYTHRVGAEIGVANVYSSSEFVSHLEAYVWDAELDDWKEIKSEKLFS